MNNELASHFKLDIFMELIAQQPNFPARYLPEKKNRRNTEKNVHGPWHFKFFSPHCHMQNVKWISIEILIFKSKIRGHKQHSTFLWLNQKLSERVQNCWWHFNLSFGFKSVSGTFASFNLAFCWANVKSAAIPNGLVFISRAISWKWFILFVESVLLHWPDMTYFVLNKWRLVRTAACVVNV